MTEIPMTSHNLIHDVDILRGGGFRTQKRAFWRWKKKNTKMLTILTRFSIFFNEILFVHQEHYARKRWTSSVDWHLVTSPSFWASWPSFFCTHQTRSIIPQTLLMILSLKLHAPVKLASWALWTMTGSFIDTIPPLQLCSTEKTVLCGETPTNGGG